MIVLTEQIEIPASYEKLKAWTANFEEEFVKWSPYHIECNLYNGNYHAGSKVRFREIVMGLDYDVTGTITECEQDENHFRIVFRSDKKTAFITFEGKRTETGCHFSHTEAFGMTTPVIGAIMNFLIFKVFVADGLFCREIDGLFCRSSPDIIVRRRCVLSHKRRGWLQPSPSFRYSRNLALQDELYHPVINNGPAVLVCVDKRLGTGPVNQSRDAG